MAYSAFAVANAFVQRATQGHIPHLNPLKLQRLLYLAQAWHLKGTNGRGLLDDHFARWQSGPVIPAVFHLFKAFRDLPIHRLASTMPLSDQDVHIPIVPEHDTKAWALIDAVIQRYGHEDDQTLTALLQQTGSAWALGLPDGGAITAQEILQDLCLDLVP